MKTIIRKIQQILFIIFDSFVNFLFCVRLLYELKYEPYDEHKIKTIKVLLQFLAKSFDNSAFEYYSLNNEDYLWPIYETIKKKNSAIFQLIVLLHSFIFNHLIYQIVYTIFGYSCYIDKYFAKLNKKLDKYTKIKLSGWKSDFLIMESCPLFQSIFFLFKNACMYHILF